jgi:hypothetical protein
MSNEALLGFEFFYGLFAPDTTLQSLAPGGVSRDEADPGTATPFVIVSLQSPGNDALTITAYRVMSQPLYLLKVVGPSSVTTQIGNAYARIEALLGDRDGLRNQSTPGAFIPAIYRESPFMQGELVNGEKWQNIGGLWRMQMYQTT